jgi:hypothetical protein
METRFRRFLDKLGMTREKTGRDGRAKGAIVSASMKMLDNANFRPIVNFMVIIPTTILAAGIILVLTRGRLAMVGVAIR